jgi:hypothetical protein
MEETKKFMAAEIIFGILLYLTIDIGCILLDLTGVGLIIAPIIQSGAVLVMSLWFLIMHGDSGSFGLTRQIMKHVAGVIPVIPTTTIICALEMYLHNHPDGFLARAFGVAGSFVKAKVKMPGGKDKGSAKGLRPAAAH